MQTNNNIRTLQSALTMVVDLGSNADDLLATRMILDDNSFCWNIYDSEAGADVWVKVGFGISNELYPAVMTAFEVSEMLANS